MSAPETDALSESVDWSLAEGLFDQKIILIVGGLTPATVAAFGFSRTGQSWFCWWGLAAVVVLAARVGLNAAFARRRVRSGRPALWRRRFLLGAWANGALAGIGGAYAVLAADSFTQMLVITMLTAFVMGSAARNSMYPKAAVGSVLLAEAPLLAACLATREIYYMLYTLFIVLFVFSALSVIRHLYAQTVAFLVTDEERAVLLREISHSNSELAATNVNLAIANEQLAAANAKLAAIAGTDGLTGVPNRRSFDDVFEIEMRSARRNGHDLSLLMCDIDSFKGYNDRYGHQAGDECLRRVAVALDAGVRRPRDHFARYGGEEFVAILPQTDLAGAVAIAETLLSAVQALGLEHRASTFGIVTVSIGVAACAGTLATTAAELLGCADGALYVAKQSGRNRVHAAPDPRDVSAIAAAAS